MTETPHPWDRLPKESLKAYGVFRAYCAMGSRRSIRELARQEYRKAKSNSGEESELVIATGKIVTTVTQWLNWSAKHHWVSRTIARDEWFARTADEQVQANLHQCYLAITTVAHEFISSKIPEKVRIGSAMLKDHYPPVSRVADVSERFEDLSDVPDDQLARMRAIRDAAREANSKGQDSTVH